MSTAEWISLLMQMTFRWGALRIASSLISTTVMTDALAQSAPIDMGSVVPEVLVLGQRTQNVDSKRTEADTQPYVVLSGEWVSMDKT